MTRYKQNRGRDNQPSAEPDAVVEENDVSLIPAPAPVPTPPPKPEPAVEEWKGAHLGDEYVCIAQTYFGDKLYEVGEPYTARRDHQELPVQFVTKEVRAEMVEEERLDELRKDAAFEDNQAAIRKVQLGL